MVTSMAAGQPEEPPNYNYSEELLPPSAIGVKYGSSFSQVYDNIRGVNYYVDAIGFGEGTGLNKGRPMQLLGIRYFMDTGFTCSNGARRYEYVDTVPKGDALGKFVKNEIAAQGLPALRGLAPGMAEDAEIALNPLPLINAALNDTGYCECELADLPVGDASGKIVSRGGSKWLTPDSTKGGMPHQARWIRKRDITREEYDATPKIFNTDGSRKSADDVKVDTVRQQAAHVEGFEGDCLIYSIMIKLLILACIFVISAYFFGCIGGVLKLSNMFPRINRRVRAN